MATELMISVADDGRISGATASDAEAISELTGTYRAVLTRPKGRSLDQLGLWWSMCSMVAENWPGETLSKDNVSDVLKIASGHFTTFMGADGQYRRVPRSIAFNKMDGPEFSALLDTALAKAGELFGGALSDAVRAELDRMGQGEPMARAA